MTDAHGAFSSDDALETATADLLRLMWSLRQTATRAFETLGITLAQTLMLFYITQGRTSPKALANALGVHPAAVSASLAEFEGRGLVERLRDAQDKRRVEVRLTRLGDKMVNATRKAWQDANTPTLGGLSTGELQELSKLCLVLLENEES